MAGAAPMCERRRRPVGCVDIIEVVAASLPLAPVARELEFRGALFQSGWRVSLKEEIGGPPSIASTPEATTRRFPLCGRTGPEDQTLLLGAVPRAEATRQVAPKRRQKRR